VIFFSLKHLTNWIILKIFYLKNFLAESRKLVAVERPSSAVAATEDGNPKSLVSGRALPTLHFDYSA
jgi:hypothetical protein